MLRQWNEMTSTEFAGLGDPTIVILPVAATEQHGPHLPTGTDSFILAGILEALSNRREAAQAVALPLQPIMAICRARCPSMPSSLPSAGSPSALQSLRRV
jgi:creatinine amidohydrolase/Fe(II)-dependent formamide hydrolase-like protein